MCTGRERVKRGNVYVYVQRCCASGELQCPSLGISVSPQAMGTDKGATLLSSTTFCSSSYLVLSFSQLLFYLLLSSSLGWVDQGSQMPLGFSNVTHQGLGVSSAQPQKQIPAVTSASYVCLFLRFKLYTCLYINAGNSETSQSVLTGTFPNVCLLLLIQMHTGIWIFSHKLF